MMRIAIGVVVASVLAAGLAVPAMAADGKIRVLFVGGDWKSQLPNFQGKTPLRGFFVRQEVEKAAPGKFEFTLWTSYEFLQYGDSASLKQFDVVVCGDTMGQSVMPRLVKGLTDFVEGGGGFMYCDNHKAFSFNTKELSFDPVLPIEVVPFRPYGPEASQPTVGATEIRIADADHPIVRGLAWATAPKLGGACTGKVKAGAKVIATAAGGEPIWVAWEKGKGRALWAGGVFANDEKSEAFSTWPEFGKFYAQALAWLAGKSTYPRIALANETATATLTVDLAKKGPEVTSKHFGIHGQEDSGGSYPMQGADLALYQALNLEGTFARIGGASNVPKPAPGDKKYEYLDTSTDITQWDWSQYQFGELDRALADCARLKAEPISLYWCPWKQPGVDFNPKRWTKYFAAGIEHANGAPGTPQYKPVIKYFEIMNEPDLSPAAETLPKYADFFNYAAGALAKRYPGVSIGCGGFFEWTYLQSVMDRCGKNLGWISRHPYGHTGEAVFSLQDEYLKHAKTVGLKDLKFIVTEWDFWIYGEPAFDYIMQRWKPELDHADTCLGSLHYRWREYHEGGYVFGVHGEFNERYGELPPEWPNPGKDKPITYRYNAWWIMRDCRGPQFAADLKSPQLAGSPSTRVYAVATSSGGRFNIVAYYGYPYADLAKGKSYGKIKLKIQAPIPPEVKGRTLVISRADARNIKEEPAQTIQGDAIDLEVELPAQSGVSLTVK